MQHQCLLVFPLFSGSLRTAKPGVTSRNSLPFSARKGNACVRGCLVRVFFICVRFNDVALASSLSPSKITPYTSFAASRDTAMLSTTSNCTSSGSRSRGSPKPPPPVQSTEYTSLGFCWKFCCRNASTSSLPPTSDISDGISLFCIRLLILESLWNL